MTQIVDLNKAYAEVQAKMEATILTNPTIVSCFHKFENTLENMNKAYKKELANANNKNISMDEDAILKMHNLRVQAYKKNSLTTCKIICII